MSETETGAQTPASGGSASEIAEQARQAGSVAASHAADLASEARNRAASLAGTVADQAQSYGAAQKDKATAALEDVARAVHKTGTELEGSQDWAARLVELGAAELNGLASTLRRNDLQGLLENIGGLARRQPAVFLGASMAAGFLMTRVGRLAVETSGQEGRTDSSGLASPSQYSPSDQSETQDGTR